MEKLVLLSHLRRPLVLHQVLISIVVRLFSFGLAQNAEKILEMSANVYMLC